MKGEQDTNGLIFRIRMPSLFAIVRTAFSVNLLRLYLPSFPSTLYLKAWERTHTTRLRALSVAVWLCDGLTKYVGDPFQVRGMGDSNPRIYGLKIDVGFPHKNLKAEAFRHNAKSKYLVSK